jgi:hypothetical protein
MAETTKTTFLSTCMPKSRTIPSALMSSVAMSAMRLVRESLSRTGSPRPTDGGTGELSAVIVAS